MDTYLVCGTFSTSGQTLFQQGVMTGSGYRL